MLDLSGTRTQNLYKGQKQSPTIYKNMELLVVD